MKKRKEIREAIKNFIILLILAVAFSTSTFLVIKKAMDNRTKEETIEKGEQVEGKLDKTQLAIKINSSVTFINSNLKGNLGIENKSNNVHDVIVKIYIKETNELIYTSPKLSPGYKIDDAILDKKLSKGSYECIAYFEAYDKDNKLQGKSGVEINIRVKN